MSQTEWVRSLEAREVHWHCSRIRLLSPAGSEAVMDATETHQVRPIETHIRIPVVLDHVMHVRCDGDEPFLLAVLTQGMLTKPTLPELLPAVGPKDVLGW